MSEQKTDTQNQAAPAVTPTEAPAPKLAAGLFQTFTLGSTLEQAAHGNVMNNVKPNMMDYVKQAGNHKNQSLDAETLEKLGTEEVKKAESAFDKLKNKLAHKKNPPRDPAAVAAKIGREKLGEKEMARRAAEGRKEHAKKSMDETIAEVPTEQQAAVIAELDRRIDEAKKSNSTEQLQLLEKAKEKAKKCYGPQMDYKQPKI